MGDYPKQQGSLNGPYYHLSDLDLLRVFAGCLVECDFIGDIRNKVDEMASDQFHKVDMSSELDDLQAALDEAAYRIWLYDYEAEKQQRQWRKGLSEGVDDV